MNANELADVLEELHEQDKSDGVGHLAMPEAATMLRQQQAEIEALKKTCFDEITKRVYADQTTKVIEGYWGEAQAEIEALKAELRGIDELITGKAQEK